MTAWGTKVTIETAEQYEKLLAHPASLHGEFDPVVGYGEVWFATPAAAAAAWRKL